VAATQLDGSAGRPAWYGSAMLSRATRLAASSVTVLALVRCAANDAPPNDGAAGAAGASSTECSGDFDEYAPGMSKAANPGSLTLSLEDANPAPPGFGSNEWTLRVLDAEGEPVAGAVVHATPYMPAHTHGTAEVVVEDQGDGVYRLSPVVLNMPGVWEVAIDVQPPEGTLSEALFAFCVPES
jgi:hypothetical protein